MVWIKHRKTVNRETRKRYHSRFKSCLPKHEKSEKNWHHKKFRRKERNDYDSDEENINVSPPPKILKSDASTSQPPEISKQHSPSPTKGGASHASLLIEETNKLRAQYGLKPLDIDNSIKDDPHKIKDDLGEFYHKPAPNVNEKLKSEKFKEKIVLWKQKRQSEANLSKIETLGECDSNEDATTLIDKFIHLQEEKKKAEERAKMRDQLDEEFGVGKLVKEDFNYTRNTAYTEKALKDLKVEDNVENFKEDKPLNLSLKDQEVFEKNDDLLVNINMENEDDELGKEQNHTTIKSGKMRIEKSMCDSLTPLSDDSKAEPVILEAAVILVAEPSLD